MGEFSGLMTQESLTEFKQQLEEVRQNRQRADEDVEVRPWGGVRGRDTGEHLSTQALEPSLKPRLSHCLAV